jgi:hypothetical protein
MTTETIIPDEIENVTIRAKLAGKEFGMGVKFAEGDNELKAVAFDRLVQSARAKLFEGGAVDVDVFEPVGTEDEAAA